MVGLMVGLMGALETAPGGPACPAGGSGLLSTLPAGAGCGGSDPVVSFLAGAEVPSLNRDTSPLQAATPMVISASAAARRQNREHNRSRTQDIATHTHTQHKPSLNTLRVNKHFKRLLAL